MKPAFDLHLCSTVLAASLAFSTAFAQGGAGTGNPDPAALSAGQALFTSFGCVGCHGSDGEGARGPNLTDDTWIYGGDAESITETLVKGRPNGMPAIGGNATPEEVEQLVEFVRSLSAKP